MVMLFLPILNGRVLYFINSSSNINEGIISHEPIGYSFPLYISTEFDVEVLVLNVSTPLPFHSSRC